MEQEKGSEEHRVERAGSSNRGSNSRGGNRRRRRCANETGGRCIVAACGLRANSGLSGPWRIWRNREG